MIALNSRSICFRLVLRLSVCLFFFILGCSVSFSLIDTDQCVSQHSRIPAATLSNPNQAKSLEVSLVVIIVSAPDNLLKRHALRRTWLTFADHSTVKYLFVIGSKGINDELHEKIITEHDQYSDLLILPEVEEGYDLLSRKILQSFVWAKQNIIFKFLLKVDDDSFVDIRKVLRELSGKSPDDRIYWGYFNGRAQVQQKGKWRETEWNLCDRYLPYARGGGYVLSKSLIFYLADNAAALSIFKNEDVSVGAWLAPLNVTRIHDPRFDTEWTSRGCSNQYLVTHPHTEDNMRILYDSLSNHGHLCPQEFQKRAPYSYNWNVLPSHCCSNPAPKDI